MKKLLAGALALTLAFSMSACAKSNEGSQGETKGDEQTSPVDDGLVTIYQRVLATSYKADGSRGYYQNHYTYDERGNLLAIETDRGPAEVIWYDDYNISYTVYHPFDGTINESTYFVYTDDGCVRDYGRYDGPVIENGKLKKEAVSRSADLYYTYLSDGRINTVEQYVMDLDGPMYDEPTYSDKCNYNENKQLVSVIGAAPEHNVGNRYAEWIYDDQGRMIEERYFSMENARSYRYTYNEKGLLATVAYGYINVNCYGECTGTEELFEGSTYTYTYDDAGRLINSNGDAITYDDQGRVISYGAATITYTSDGGKRVQNGDEVYEYDQHGNLIRSSDGDDYVEFEYREIRVTKAEAKRLAYFDLQRKIRDGRGRRNFTREYMCVPDYPEIPMLEYDLLINRGIY